jgi:hypothetical protein
MEHPALIAVIFIVLFLIICSLFAARDVVHMLRGMLSTITSIFVSPFIYLKKAITELADYGKKGDKILVCCPRNTIA